MLFRSIVGVIIINLVSFLVAALMELALQIPSNKQSIALSQKQMHESGAIHDLGVMQESGAIQEFKIITDLEQGKQYKQKTLSFTQVLRQDMKESYQYLIHENRIVFRMLLFSGFYNLFLVPIFSVVAPYLIKITFAQSSEVYGMAEGVIALGKIGRASCRERVSSPV